MKNEVIYNVFTLGNNDFFKKMVYISPSLYKYKYELNNFNQIRNKIGDREFSNFLQLEICDENKHRKSASHRLLFSSHLIILFIFMFL